MFTKKSDSSWLATHPPTHTHNCPRHWASQTQPLKPFISTIFLFLTFLSLNNMTILLHFTITIKHYQLVSTQRWWSLAHEETNQNLLVDEKDQREVVEDFESGTNHVTHWISPSLEKGEQKWVLELEGRKGLQQHLGCYKN